MSVMSQIKKYGTFELGKEIEKGIFCLFTSMGQRKKTLLILAVCRTHALHNGPCSPQGLCSSVVEHQSVESGGLRFDSSWDSEFFISPTLVTRRKTCFSISLLNSKLTIFLNLLTSYIIKHYGRENKGNDHLLKKFCIVHQILLLSTYSYKGVKGRRMIRLTFPQRKFYTPQRKITSHVHIETISRTTIVCREDDY